jgi:hypothetical protein
MANIAYAAPYIPPVDPAPAWSYMGMTWTAKGSSWTLTDRDTGIFMRPGVRGFGMPPVQRFTTTAPAVPGSRFQGSWTQERDVFWPIKIWHDGGSTDWMLRDRAFWATMDPDDTGIWTITHPDGAKRTLRLRFTDEANTPSEDDPFRRGWDTYGITLTAEQPHWEGDPVVRSWKNKTYSPFFDPTGPQLFNIGSGADVSTATIDNPGDVPSYPQWFIDGATTAAQVGIGALIVTVPFVVPDGKCLVIDSDPASIGATLYDISPAQLAAADPQKPSERVIGVDLINPVDKTAALGEADFAPVPAGSSVPLSLSVAGAGTVEVKLPTLYRRAW